MKKVKKENSAQKEARLTFESALRDPALQISPWLFKNQSWLNFEQIKKCVEMGADVNYIGSNDFRKSLLMEYCQSGSQNVDLSVVEYLLDAGADINYQNYAGRNVLFLVMTQNRGGALVDLLLSRGADPYQEDAHQRDSVGVALDYAMVYVDHEKGKGFLAKAQNALDKSPPTDVLKIRYYLRLIKYRTTEPAVAVMYEKLNSLLEKHSLAEQIPVAPSSARTHKI